VREALVEAPLTGVYVVATKQAPAEMSETLAAASLAASKAGRPFSTAFFVQATRPLGTSGIAWAYVLVPVAS
jgi:heterodisulfide reductase subunit A-like polyferredoxin